MATAGLVLSLASGAIPDLAASLEVVHFPEEVGCVCMLLLSRYVRMYVVCVCVHACHLSAYPNMASLCI